MTEPYFAILPVYYPVFDGAPWLGILTDAVRVMLEDAGRQMDVDLGTVAFEFTKPRWAKEYNPALGIVAVTLRCQRKPRPEPVDNPPSSTERDENAPSEPQHGSKPVIPGTQPPYVLTHRNE